MASQILADNTSQSLLVVVQKLAVLEFLVQNVSITNLSVNIEFFLGLNPIPPFA
jgi:hypothetical protein